MKTPTQGRFGILSIPSIKKLAPGLVLLSIVLSGVLMPVSFSDKNYGPVGTRVGMFTKLPVAMAAEDIIKKDGKWYYGGNYYENYTDAVSARGERASFDGGNPDIGGATFLEGLSPEQRSELAVAHDPKPISCSGVLNFWSTPLSCLWRSLIAAVSSILITVAAWVLAVAGILFNWSVVNSIILFKASIFEPIKDAINVGWTAFRDLSNIAIIGMFTFIAISIILGNKEYGKKRLIARVLVIAVLINFSLLFTKIIIDASNFTAAQFYAATTGQTIRDALATSQTATNASTGLSLTSGGYAQSGIAGAFVGFLGVTGAGDTFNAVREGADNMDSGWMALVHAIFAATFLLGAAIVLLYGSFLLISRAVLLIFLMLVSALAFASHLVPKLSDGTYGWSAWWKSLLGNAVLAPILMVFLWITLQISAKLAEQGGTLGNLISGKASGADINSLFVYLIVLGLLFASFKLASKFSSTIGGFNYAQMATALPFAAASRLAAMGLRNAPWLGGRGAAIRSMQLEDEIKRERASERYLGGDTKAMAGLMRQKDRADWRAKSTYDPMNTRLAQTFAKSLGLSGMFTDKTKTNFAEIAKARAAAAAEKATMASATRTDAEKLVADQRASLVRDRDAKDESLRLQRQTAKEAIRSGGHGEALEEAQKTMQEAQKAIVEAKKGLANNTGNRQVHNDTITAETERIKKAEVAVKESRGHIDRIMQPVVGAEKKLDEAEKKIEKLNAHVTNIVNKSAEGAVEVAEKLAHGRISNLLPRMFGEQPENDHTAKLARRLAEKRIKFQVVKEKRLAEDEMLADAGVIVPGAQPKKP
ncbi:MAG: hypothetical protein AAB830_00125 [Patescibacteria group bacterium]